MSAPTGQRLTVLGAKQGLVARWLGSVRWLLLCGALALALCPVVAEDAAPAAFEEANRLYEQARFKEAARAYQALLDAGRVSAELHFNAGNAHFKSGQLGRAIHHYLAARRLSPRDPDIEANLQFARDSAGTAPPPVPFWQRWLSRFSTDEWALATSVLGWTWLLLLTLRAVWAPLERSTRGLTRAAGAGFAVLALCTAANTWGNHGIQVAVVVEPEAVVRYGPLEESQSYFTLRDGAEVAWKDRKGDWVQVTDAAGRTGWTRASQLALPSQGGGGSGS
jgi:tetratricopeptide (TPR) repeat protein